MIKSKIHLPCIHRERIMIQIEMHIWLKTMLVPENLPDSVLDDIFDLCVSQYHDVRNYGQGLLMKVLGRTEPFGHKKVMLRYKSV